MNNFANEEIKGTDARRCATRQGVLRKNLKNFDDSQNIVNVSQIIRATKERAKSSALYNSLTLADTRASLARDATIKSSIQVPLYTKESIENYTINNGRNSTIVEYDDGAMY